MERCKNCGSVYLHQSVGKDFCTINCFKFFHNNVEVDDTFHIVSKIRDYNEEVPELDTMDKVFAYKEQQALVD